MKKLAILCFALLFLASCGDDGDFSWPFPPACPQPPESELLKRVYEGPRWPADLAVDPQMAEVQYLGFNDVGSRDYPCAGTVAEAESLATAAGFLVDGISRETELYFEFNNLRTGYGYPIVRVFKSSYLASLTDVALFDVGWPGSGISKIGPIVHRPLTADVVLRLFDEVWLQGNFDASATLISRQLEEQVATFVLTTHEAQLVSGDLGVCDRVYQIVTTYIVEKATGEVSLTRFVLPDVIGRCPYGT